MKPGVRVTAFVLLLLFAAVAAAQKERPLTEKEKAELDRAVDDILAFVSEGTGLKVKEPVRREFTDRAGLRAHFEKSFTEKKYAGVTPAGAMAWNSSEGPVWIEARGDEVLVLEGFTSDGSERVRAAAWESVTPR